jgi:hypothetical protein
VKHWVFAFLHFAASVATRAETGGFGWFRVAYLCQTLPGGLGLRPSDRMSDQVSRPFSHAAIAKPHHRGKTQTPTFFTVQVWRFEAT